MPKIWRKDLGPDPIVEVPLYTCPRCYGKFGADMVPTQFCPLCVDEVRLVLTSTLLAPSTSETVEAPSLRGKIATTLSSIIDKARSRDTVTADSKVAVDTREKCAFCGSNVERRTNKSTGRPFLGCTRWPGCIWTRNLSAAEVAKADISRFINERVAAGATATALPGENELAKAFREVREKERELEESRKREAKKRDEELREFVRRQEAEARRRAEKAEAEKRREEARREREKAAVKAAKAAAEKKAKAAKRTEIEKRFSGLDFGDEDDADLDS